MTENLSEPPRRKAPLKVRLAAILAALLCALTVAEIAARFLYPVVHQTRHFNPGMFIADRERGWVPRPGYEGVYAEFFSETPVRVNRRGMRGPEPVPEDFSAPIRILCLGDSNTFGLGVGDHETFPAQLDAALTGGERSVAVWNAGVVGYATRQEKITLEKHQPDFKPTLVILGWLRNDVGMEAVGSEVIDGYVTPSRRAYERFRRSQDNRPLYEVSRLVTVLNIFIKLARHQGGTARAAKDAAHERDDPEQIQRNVSLVKEMAGYSRRSGARFLVLTYDGRPQMETGTEHPILSDFHRRMEAEGIETLSIGDLLRDDFAAREESLFILRDNIHLNARGHRLAAKAVARRITE